MGYIVMCARDQEIDPFANIFFASRSAKFAKFESLENYALAGSTPLHAEVQGGFVMLI